MPKKKKNNYGYSFSCIKCKKVHQKDAYCIAQQAMGYTMYFTCDCGKKQEVPS